MSPIQDTRYLPIPFVYRSRGLVARPVEDQAPPDSYLNLMNCLERAENSVSSRYGTVIVNRDPAGTANGQNYLFSSPVITLARMLYQSFSYRYAVTYLGQLYRRTGSATSPGVYVDTQGPYTLIASGLSGQTPGWLTTTCYASAQNYLFLFDRNTSIKDAGTATAPELIGIDPPTHTANTLPYSPLLSLVDNFAAASSYATSGWATAPAWQLITTFPGATGTVVNDFVQFLPSSLSPSPIVNGMLALPPSGVAPSSVGILTITSYALTSGTYISLQIVTAAPHGITTSAYVSIYGSSNNLCDGFYFANVTGTTTLLVTFDSAVYISATGGTLWFSGSGSLTAQPATCVLTNIYTAPYPPQFTAWGFYSLVSPATANFPISCWTGTVAQNTTATIGKTVNLNFDLGNEVTDNDLIVVTLAVGDPASISNIRLQFDLNSSNYTTSYYYKDISPAYYQQGVQQLEDAYTTTEQQIFADTLNLITGQPPNSTTAQLQPASLSTGQGSWVAALLRRGDFLAVGSAGTATANWSNVTGWQLVITTSTVGSSTVSMNGIYLQWGYGPTSFGGTGYDYRYTYLNATTLSESNASPIQSFDPQFGYLSSLTPPLFLSQAAQVTGIYSSDPQVTHVRIYRRGGTANQNWYQIDQIPNLTQGGPFADTFIYKDVIPDAAITQARPLQLDNDPPVTSPLSVPLASALSLATTAPASTYYAQFSPQTFTLSTFGGGSTFTFIPGQIVQVGGAANLEGVRVITGGTGSFTAICRLQHNAGESVQVYALPRATCILSVVAYNQVWLAGDQRNTHYLYFSKPGFPESFPPENYIPVGQAGQAITALVNWRGTLFVRTTTTWFQIVGGASPYPQPTGCKHGGNAIQGWTEVDSSIWFLAPDGLRDFRGADAPYMSLDIEFIFRQNPATPLPLADPAAASQTVMAFYNQCVYTSYLSLNGGRYRIIYDLNYRRWRIDDISATAMLWEQDTNTFLVAKPYAANGAITGYVIAVDQVTTQDYDDGGWQQGALVQTPIQLTLQPTFQDLGRPHFPKQWNVLENDVNTANQQLTTQLLFDSDAADSSVVDPLPNPVTTQTRQKVERQITGFLPDSSGAQAYRMSWVHQVTVLSAPTFYQENIYAALLADYRTSFDTYWLSMGTDKSKIFKQGYFDYSSSVPVSVSLFADGSQTAYFSFILPATYTIPPSSSFASVASVRQSVRAIFLHKKPRLWRLIATTAAAIPFQLWAAPQIEWKPIDEGSTYAITELTI